MLIWCDESSFLPKHSDNRFKISHKHHESMNESYLVSVIQAADGVKVQEIFPWSTLGPVIPFTTRLMSILLWSSCTHLLIVASSRITHHVPKVKSSQNGFLNLTRKSLRTFGMWWNMRFTSGMCSQQICYNCVMLSCQYIPKTLRWICAMKTWGSSESKRRSKLHVYACKGSTGCWLSTITAVSSR